MKRLKEVVLGILVIVVVGYLVLLIYRHESGRQNRELARRIAELSPRGGPPETIEGLRQAITLYEDQIERNVREGAQTGAYWKILATRLADRGMHNDALAALERAVYFNAEDPSLFFMTGSSAGIVAKSIVGFSANAELERENYYKLSENAYLRALDLDNRYARPLYGLGVLYVFELNRPAEAIPYLERYLEIQQSDIPAMFVLARAHYMLRDFRKAIELYERIIVRSKDNKTKMEAENNIEIIQRMLYE